MKPFKYSFDPACLTLAEHFLPSQVTQAVKNELAQAIQNAVEDFCGVRCDGCKKSIDPDWCHCGERIVEGVGHDNHSPIPMGCDCFRVG